MNNPINRARALSDANKNLVMWLMETCPAIYCTIQLRFIFPKRKKKPEEKNMTLI